jgi:hypothetical protein
MVTASHASLASAILGEAVLEDWDIYVVNEVRDWIQALDAEAHARVVQAIDALAETGPGLGRRWRTRLLGHQSRI